VCQFAALESATWICEGCVGGCRHFPSHKFR
jgi:hypothetical protein